MTAFMGGLKHGSWLSRSSRLCQSAASGQSGLENPGGASTSPAVRKASTRGAAAEPPLQVPVPPLELDFISGPRTGERLTLFDRRCTMGRGEAATIQIADPMLANVSRIHCVFEYIGNRWYICDNGSTNGTWKRLSCVLEPSKPLPLAPGTSILAGVHEFRVEEGDVGQWWLPSAAVSVLREMSDREQQRQ